MVRHVFLSSIALAGCSFTPGLAPDGNGASDASDVIDAHIGASARRKPITIHGDLVTATQNDFPVWIDLIDSELATRARSDGTDIFFTAADGAPLDHEIQRWSPGTQHLQAWVRLPKLVNNVDALIHVEYGDVTKAAPPNSAGVFKASFAAVWHLDDSLATTTVADATDTHAGLASMLTPTEQVNARLGGGFAFDGSGARKVTFMNPLTGSTVHTISAWVNQEVTTHTSAIVVVGTANTDQSRFLYGHYGNGQTVGAGYYNDDLIPNSNLEGSGWILLHWVLEGPNRKNHLYRNGIEITGSGVTSTGVAATSGTAGFIGFAPMPAYGSSNGMNGVIDELRIATVARSPSWIAMEYANQSSPSTFYSVGAEQSVP